MFRQDEPIEAFLEAFDRIFGLFFSYIFYSRNCVSDHLLLVFIDAYTEAVIFDVLSINYLFIWQLNSLLSKQQQQHKELIINKT